MVDYLVRLEGRQVVLEPLSLNHIPDLVQATNQSRDSFAFTEVPADEDAMRRYVETALVGRDSGTILPFATMDRKTQSVVGSTRFGNIQFWNWPVGVPTNVATTCLMLSKSVGRGSRPLLGGLG